MLLGKLLDLELSIRGILRGFGLKLGEATKSRFAGRVRELAAGQAMLEAVGEPMLRAREALRTEAAALHRRMLAVVGGHEVCRRLMTVPGVGGGAVPSFVGSGGDPARVPGAEEGKAPPLSPGSGILRMVAFGLQKTTTIDRHT